MSLPLRLTTAAERDMREARGWYEKEAPPVAPRLREEIRATFQRIAERPRLYPIMHHNVRRAVVHRFPYAVFYRIEDDAILVVAIVHSARDPRVWQRRG